MTRRQDFDDEVVLDYDRVQDKFQLPALNELFTRISTQLTPYSDDDMSFTLNPMALAHGYLIRSGRKILPDYIIRLPDWTGTAGTTDVVDVLYDVLMATYFRKWQQLRDAFYTLYAPLEGIDYTETRTGSHVGTESLSGTTSTGEEKTQNTTHGEKITSQSNFTHGETVSDDNTTTHGKTLSEQSTIIYGHGETDATTELPGQITSTTATSNGVEDVYGFNSDSAVPKSTDSASNTETTKTSGRNSTEVVRSNTGSDETSGISTEGGITADSRSIRHGGIDTTNDSVVHSGVDTVGSQSAQTETVNNETATADTDNVQVVRKGRVVQTPQQLLEEEVKVRNRTFIDIMYQDIDSVLTISVY